MNTFIKSNLLVSIIIILCQTCFAQSDSTETHQYITARYHKGIVIPHHSSMLYLLEDYVSGFEISYGRSKFKSDSWEKYFNYPEIGLGFYYGTFGNKEVYGHGMALFPYINYKMARTPKFSLQNKVSMGLGYASEPFDLQSNPYNLVSGSHFHVYVGFALLADYRINKQFSLALSGAVNHLSNGATQKPNHGINTVSASLGLKYHFNPALTPITEKIKAPKSKMKEFIAVASVGTSQAEMGNPKIYWNSSLSLNHIWHLNARRGIGLGLDGLYMPIASYIWRPYEEYKEGSEIANAEKWALGTFLAYHVYLNKTTLVMNLGTYLYSGVKPPEPLYSRLGVRYNINDHLVANFSVKASFFKSEFLEFGIGYRIKYGN
ncbi:acyloxyacyl hydrolase [Labilibacter marinus]|uniref:acyloxyacyl hydrolase n=1 Tax=Labilibacter marinus TaxID=1477105 RepID=UPI00117AF841|nr:acyloxyacyl hydrolase [Labilibacter marinus]